MKAAYRALVARRAGRRGARLTLSREFLRAYYAAAAEEIGLADGPDGGLSSSARGRGAYLAPWERLRTLIDSVSRGASSTNDDIGCVPEAINSSPPNEDGNNHEVGAIEAKLGSVPRRVVSSGSPYEQESSVEY